MSKTIQEAFIEAVAANAEEEYATLLKHGADKESAFFLFAHRKDLPAVDRMLEMGVDINANNSNIIYTAIYDHRGSTDKTDLALLNEYMMRGAKLTLKHLWSVVYQNDFEAAALLLAQPSIDIQKASEAFNVASDEMAIKLIDAGYPTTSSEDLDNLARHGREQAVKRFLDAGVKATKATIQNALFSGSDPVIEMTIKNAVENGLTAEALADNIHTAIHMNNLKAFRLLIEADPVNAERLYGTVKYKMEDVEEFGKNCKDREGLIGIYRLISEMAGHPVDEELCKFPEAVGETISGQRALRELHFGPL